MVYAAKCFWPGVTSEELELIGASAVREARRISRLGRPVAYLGSMLFPDDELVLCLFEGSTRAAVKQANDRAGIPCERIMESVWLARPEIEGGAG
jgi:hypothetical protein